jgi:uroporphyrinogen decarboxylase
VTEGMAPRERVLRAFAHEEPDRVPRWCGASPGFLAKARRELGLADDEAVLARFGDDFRRVHARYVGPDPPLSPGAESRTVFGIERHGLGYGQPMAHPLAGASVRAIHAYPWPEPDWWDVSHVRADALRWQGRYAILGGDWSPFWHDAIDLFGMEGLLLRMSDEPGAVDAALGHIVDYYAEVSRRIFEVAADAIDIFFVGNDFGSQTGPLVGPREFERFLLPHLARLIDLGHSYGLLVQLHCCGGVEPLLEAMIEAGLDGFHAVQPCCAGMDLAHLKTTCGDRLLLNGAIDSQRVLIEGTPDTVREATREVLATLAPGSGYVAGASHDYILEETPVANVLAMFDAVEEFGRYPIGAR